MMHEAGQFPSLQWHVTQDVIDAYAEVSGDKNPLHVDPDFAATTRFGGTISHGFLTMAWLSQWATAYFGDEWLTSGEVAISFIGAVRPGDVVTVRAELEPDTPGRHTVRVACHTDESDVVVGTVSVAAEN